MADDTDEGTGGLPPLVTPDRLALKTGADPEDDRVRLAVDMASARFREQTGNPISLATETIVMDSPGSRTLVLPLYPVWEAHDLTIAGNPVDEWEWSRDGAIRTARPMPDLWRGIAVTYTHGYDPVPAGIQDVVLEQAQAMYELLPTVVSYTTGAESRQYSAAMTVGTTAQWAAMVAKYRIGRGANAG